MNVAFHVSKSNILPALSSCYSLNACPACHSDPVSEWLSERQLGPVAPSALPTNSNWAVTHASLMMKMFFCS